MICLTALSACLMSTMVLHMTCASSASSGLLQQQSETSRIVGDKGYRGRLGIVHPLSKRTKRSRELEALQDEKSTDHELESERAAIENINARVKEWAVIRGVWRGGYSRDGFVDKMVRVVCALTNLVFHEHPIRCKKRAQ